MKEYIHSYQQNLDTVKRHITQSEEISEKNKQLIFDFEKATLLVDQAALPTRYKYVDVLSNTVRRYTSKDLDQLTRKDYEDIVMKLEQNKDIKPATKQKYRAVLKKFGRWVAFGNQAFMQRTINPETVAWIPTSIKKNEKSRINASDLLTEEEVDKLIEVAEHPRDKAFISMLYELGARIGEIGSLRIKDIKADCGGYLINLEGKTGQRNPIIIRSAGALTVWLNQHPLRHKPEAPLWVIINRVNGKHKKVLKEGEVLKRHLTFKKKNEKFDYHNFVLLIRRLVSRAGITKKVHAHLFRHTRVTHVLTNGEMTETQAKVYFGWVPNTKVIAEYSHLTSMDANNGYRKALGLMPEDHKKNELKKCYNCSTINDKTAIFCTKCSRPLSYADLERYKEKETSREELLNHLFKQMLSNPKIAEELDKILTQNKAVELIKKSK